MSWIINEFISSILVVVFGGITIWCFSSKAPVNFWAGDNVKPEEISDIKAYNRSNGILWGIFTLPHVISLAVIPINTFTAVIIQAIGIVIGIPLIVIAYNKIEKKYRNKGKIKE